MTEFKFDDSCPQCSHVAFEPGTKMIEELVWAAMGSMLWMELKSLWTAFIWFPQGGYCFDEALGGGQSGFDDLFDLYRYHYIGILHLCKDRNF